ncbi:Disease resistance protein [Corchorus capsularis]|uniref:Disease resistance protein n=1 Tax=Corchorus capsularis TaxID=210143 RepID=A0A1R3GF84_COCAP|nr:Disease resistance protein [Corchorus capsularis]
MPVDVAGAALGGPFAELLRLVIEGSKRVAMFSGQLKEIKSTLSSLEPKIKEIDSLNRELDKEQDTKDLKEIITKGQKLVTESLKISNLNFYKRAMYSKKLGGLNKELLRHCTIVMQTQQSTDILNIRTEVRTMSLEIKKLSLREPLKSLSGAYSQVGVVGSCKVPKPRGEVLGFDVHLRELKPRLLKDGVSVIVVSAPGGSGKTTLVQELCQDKVVKEKFKDNIFYIIVSKAPNMEVILQKLLQLEDYAMPKFQSEVDALNQVEQNFREMGPNPILLILDDVWPGSESLVDKLKFSLPDYKILVTSRVNFHSFDFNYRLKPLNDDDAMKLFRHFAFKPDEKHDIPNDLVDKVMKSCKGLPLALDVVGKSLCGQPVPKWKKRVKDKSKGLPLFQPNDELFSCLQSSLDSLDDIQTAGIKDCFLDLGSFPEDHRIPATALVDMWAEQYKLDEDDAIVNLVELYKRNLVDLVVIRKDASEADGYYNEYFVMQHDLLREFAIDQSSLEPVEKRKRLIAELSSNNFPDWWSEGNKQSLSAGLLSISTDETFSKFNWGNIQAPEVEVLVLNFRTKNYTLPTFMDKMHKLKVLIVTNNGLHAAELSNFVVLSSSSNLKRIRLEKVSIPSFGLSSFQLKNLRKMSLVMCNISQAFKNGSSKMSDVFPNLLEIDIDYCDDLKELTDGLCDLVQLMKLSITNCHKLSALPEGIGKLINLQVLRLSSCTDLKALPETIESLSQLNILDISDCFRIRKLPIQIGELHNLRKLYMRGCNCDLPSTIRRLQNLRDVICDEETADQWDSFKSILTDLNVTVRKEDINLKWLES